MTLALCLLAHSALRAQDFAISHLYTTVVGLPPGSQPACDVTTYDPTAYQMPNGDLKVLTQGNKQTCSTGGFDSLWAFVRDSATGTWTTLRPDSCPDLKGAYTRCGYNPVNPVGPLGGPSVVKVGSKYYMAFSGGNADFIAGRIYWGVSSDGTNWDVYDTSYVNGSWKPLVGPKYGNDCDTFGVSGVILAYDPSQALGPEGGFYLYLNYYHPAAQGGNAEVVAFRFSYSSSHPYGFGTSLREIFREEGWGPHTGLMVWDYDGLPAEPGDPVLRKGRSVTGFKMPLATPSAMGDIKFEPVLQKWVYVFSRFGKLLTQTSPTLAGGQWSEPSVMDTSAYLSAFPLRPHGFIYYPGLWYGTLGSRTGLYLFVPTDTMSCQGASIDFRGLGLIATDVSPGPGKPAPSPGKFFPLVPCRLAGS